jgi:hypothetical protein
LYQGAGSTTANVVAFIGPESQSETDADFDPWSTNCNGVCKTPQMDRRRDQAADRTRAAEGKSASDGARDWTSRRLRWTTSSRIGFASAARPR